MTSPPPIRILSVVGARPNFMKIAPFVAAIDDYNATGGGTGAPPIKHCLVHTGGAIRWDF